MTTTFAATMPPRPCPPTRDADRDRAREAMMEAWYRYLATLPTKERLERLAR